MLKRSANRFLFKLVKNKPIYIFSSLILSLSSAMLNTIGTVLLVLVLFDLLGKEDRLTFSYESAIIKQLFSLFENFEGENKLIVTIATLVSIVILKNITNYASTVIGFKYTKYLVSQMKDRGLNLLCKVDLDYYHKNKTGDILFKFNREIDRTALAIKSGQKIFIISITILVYTALLTFISWQLTLVSLLAIGFILIINRFLVNLSKKLGFYLSQESKLFNRRIIDFLTGIRFIKTVANESLEYQKITRSLEDKDRTQLNAQLVSATINPITEIAVTIAVLALILVYRYLYSQSIQAFTPVFLIYLIILFRLLPFIGQLNNAILQFINTISSVEVVANFLTETNKPILKSGKTAFDKLQKGIEFQNVTFAYPNYARIALDRINFRIYLNKTVALVGFSGCGKSTIADLLTRFYDPIEGRIIVDGKNLKEYELTSLRKAIAVVSKDTFLFNNSLEYNITYGLQNVSQKDLIAAAKKAKIYQFIDRLPDKFATEVGDYPQGLSSSEEDKHSNECTRSPSDLYREAVSLSEGVPKGIYAERYPLGHFDIPFRVRNPLGLRNRDCKVVLSRKQKQKISIARAFLRNPEILILDEPNSILDPKDSSLKEAISALSRDCTTLILTKLPSTAKKADLIVVLDKGKIVETGTHQELLQRSKIYQRLYSVEFKTSQQFRQQKLAQKIAQKLAGQTNSNLSREISSNLDALLNQLQLVHESLFEDEQSEKILDESYQSAKNMLASLREYERKISGELENTN